MILYLNFASLCVLLIVNGAVSDKVPPMVSPGHYEAAQQAQNYMPPPPSPGMGVAPGQPQGFAGQPHMHQAGQYAPQQQNFQQAMPQAHAPHGAHPPQHGGPHGQPVLNAANIQHEKEHIAEHMEVPLDTSKMSEQELQFHYFKMHDNDNNNKLDGIELIHSLIHWHEQGHENPQAQHGQQAPQPKLFTDEELIQLIDPILKMDDTNQDGYIDYAEFVRAQSKAAAN